MSTQEKYAHSVWFSTCLGRYRNWRRRAQEIRVRRWCTLRYPGTNVDQPLTAISRNPPFKIPSPPLSSAQAANNPTAATVPDLETKSWPALFTRYLRHRREMVHYHVTYWVVSIIHWVVKRYLVSDDELLELDYILDRIPFQPGEPIGDRLPYFEAQASREHCEQPANLYHWDFPENQT
ncbi:hypothetical protein IWQ60_003915 [Tieghemiomyces parasiticus]|uniref:Uncharacterized protein n=1 Tax=Tieghemiomyces parasiticus TaxID=78921 RepID=A0A9W8DUD3_9FUNG|nr:hypothetical protein IWQ60_003915 [Tieghemiomyces parasiticus]